MLDLVNPVRPAGDILSRVVRLSLGGTTYELPTLTIGGNRRWRAQLDSRLSGLLDGLEAGADDIVVLFGVLGRQTDDLVDLLLGYECQPRAKGEPCAHAVHILPEREVLEDTTYEDQLVTAVREVWRAANPLVARALEATTDEAPTNGSSAPTSSPPPNTAGRRRSSKKA